VGGCTFCRIVRGEVPAHVVLDDETALAFLDARPLFPGHTLLVPRAHHETLAELPAPLLGPLFARAQRLACAVERAVSAEGTFVAINNRVSQSVPHLHVHVVPRRRKDGLRGFFWPRHPYESDAAAITVRDAIRAALAEAPRPPG
jgi:histidine triad (HIT) family protein